MTIDRFILLLLSHPSDSHTFTSLDGQFMVLTQILAPDPQEDTLWFDTVNLHTYYAGRWVPLGSFPYRQPVLVTKVEPRSSEVTDLGRAHLSFAPVNDQEIADMAAVLACEEYLRQVEETVSAYIQRTLAEFDRVQVTEVNLPDHVVNRKVASSHTNNLLARARNLAQTVLSRNLRLQELKNRVHNLHLRLSHVTNPEYVRATGAPFQGPISLPAQTPIDEEELVTWGVAQSLLPKPTKERVVQQP